MQRQSVTRRALNGLYAVSGYSAAICLILTFAIVVLQVLLNLVTIATEWIPGVKFSLSIPSYAEFAGYFFVSSSFFGLGYAFQARSHIRVSVVLDRCGKSTRLSMEIFSLCIALALACYFSFHAIQFVMMSYDFGDVSVGLVPIPVWVPQVSMATGLIILTIAILDDLTTILRVISSIMIFRLRNKNNKIPDIPPNPVFQKIIDPEVNKFLESSGIFRKDAA